MSSEEAFQVTVYLEAVCQTVGLRLGWHHQKAHFSITMCMCFPQSANGIISKENAPISPPKTPNGTSVIYL
jgi:hypothetical protein